MSDISEQISSLLSDPESLKKIEAMAQNLFGENKSNTSPTPPVTPQTNDMGFDIGNIAKISQMVQLLGTKGDDDRVRLLLALRPHLSKEKQNRLDKAVKMLKLLDIAPLLSQAGIFEF